MTSSDCLPGADTLNAAQPSEMPAVQRLTCSVQAEAAPAPATEPGTSFAPERRAQRRSSRVRFPVPPSSVCNNDPAARVAERKRAARQKEAHRATAAVAATALARRLCTPQRPDWMNSATTTSVPECAPQICKDMTDDAAVRNSDAVCNSAVKITLHKRQGSVEHAGHAADMALGQSDARVTPHAKQCKRVRLPGAVHPCASEDARAAAPAPSPNASMAPSDWGTHGRRLTPTHMRPIVMQLPMNSAAAPGKQTACSLAEYAAGASADAKCIQPSAKAAAAAAAALASQSECEHPSTAQPLPLATGLHNAKSSASAVSGATECELLSQAASKALAHVNLAELQPDYRLAQALAALSSVDVAAVARVRYCRCLHSAAICGALMLHCISRCWSLLGESAKSRKCAKLIFLLADLRN